ncbi:RHS repeat domain-containing protein [Pseudomonas syringae]|uniref:RHS repeat domain-containing protein n=1 Tax=Pseudomonas syringae TaxID=317 RepID=UPI00073615B0|nr:RHS repeat-associated core domain-containing protein [Pseudomonas syringae]KTB86469.1 toxin [Pseudomonas syringae pv. syringae PD2766]
MVESLFILHQYTPALQSVDPRGLSVASILLCRSSIDHEPEMRISQASFDVAGRLVSRWDPRLWADHAPANFTSIQSLSGQVLASGSVDAGWRVSLAGEAGQVLEAWDARGVARRTGYDALLRPTEVFEDEHCVERLLYGGPDSTDHNQCGQLIRHDDPAGTRLDDEYGLSGSVISQTRRFLQNLDEPDWPESLTGRDALLEPGEGATTRWRYNPLNETLRQTDALGNVQFLDYTVAGQLKSSRLQLDGQAEKVLVSSIQYDAQQRVMSETAGNGVMSTARYDTEDGRLLALNATRSNGQLLQDLRYDYDPVGNVMRIDDRALPAISKGQRIDSVSTYQYDTLYQLIEATGREWAVVNHGPVLPGFQSPTDPSKLADYTQTYRYDAGGNLQQLTHTGTQSHSRTLVTARYSNRSLPVIDDHIPDEAQIAAAFDVNGNLLALQAGQNLSWDRRNQLQQVRPVVRDNGMDDSERYSYDASGQRLRKVRTTQAKSITHTADVRYLPGLEVRTDTATGETLHVVVAQAGRNNVRVLHWASGKPDALENDQTRYTLNDHLGSSTLELDGQAQRVSQEMYYPFGGTSWWAGRNAIEASYKTVRYSGKERDATGLYYYGMRYYAPWLQRWINPDPAGAVEGVNLYRMVRNNPLSRRDSLGCNSYDVLNEQEMMWRNNGGSFVARGLDNFPSQHKEIVRSSIFLGKQWLSSASRHLQEKPLHRYTELVMGATFGQDWADSDNDPSGLIASLQERLTEVDKVLGPLENSESWRLQLVEGDGDDFNGMTLKTPAQGKMIWLNKTYLESSHSVGIAKTMVHESSHAVPVRGAGSYTRDFWYMSSLLANKASSEDVEDYMEIHVNRSKLINAQAPVEEGMTPSDRIEYQNLMDKMLTAGQLPKSIDAKERSEIFVEDPAVRQSIVLRNADSLAAFALQFHRPR